MSEIEDILVTIVLAVSAIGFIIMVLTLVAFVVTQAWPVILGG